MSKHPRLLQAYQNAETLTQMQQTLAQLNRSKDLILRHLR